MSFPFTLTIDWLAFTLPSGSVEDTMHILGGDWTKSEVGFRGYPLSWLSAGAGRGVGKLGTGALRAPREVHVDLSAWIVASWPLEKVRTIMQWVLKGEGHLTRLDCALDDRNSSVPLSTIRHASEAGQCVTLADRMQRILSGSIHKGTPSGETLYLGSPHSQTLLRIYDKRLELQFKERENWQEYGIRWELELKRIGPRCVDRSSLFWRKPTGLNLWSGSFGPMSIFEKPFEMRGRVSVSGPAPRLVAAAHRRVQERPSRRGEGRPDVTQDQALGKSARGSHVGCHLCGRSRWARLVGKPNCRGQAPMERYASGAAEGRDTIEFQEGRRRSRGRTVPGG